MRFSSFKLVVFGTLAAVAIAALLFFLYSIYKTPAPVAPAPQPPAPIATGPVKSSIGVSVQGRPIDAYTYGTGSTRLVFVGGMHGGYEWNSVLLAYQFLDYLNENPAAVPAALSIIVIPDANPDAMYSVVHMDGRFATSDVIADTATQEAARFNAHGVDLNRNFDCKWQPQSTWRQKTVSAGSAAFSEPETSALRDFMLAKRPAAVVFWHSQANAVYASECLQGVLPETRAIMTAYATAAGYPAVDAFDAYPVTGDAEGWLASIQIPAITVELKTHETIEWEQNLAGIQALFTHFAKPSTQ